VIEQTGKLGEEGGAEANFGDTGNAVTEAGAAGLAQAGAGEAGTGGEPYGALGGKSGASGSGGANGGNGGAPILGIAGDAQPGLCLSAVSEMSCIPGGLFLMGTSDQTDFELSTPIHRVTLPSFYLDVTEVTVGAYDDCVQRGPCNAADTVNDAGSPNDVCNAVLPDHDGHPVNCVNADDARTYCAWQGKRLPTEEEWEYAAQRPSQRLYPWGNDDPRVRIFNGCGQECDDGGFPWSDGVVGTAPVVTFVDDQSFDGVFDLAGNVSEWTQGHCDYTWGACNDCDAAAPDCAKPCSACVSNWTIARGGNFGSVSALDVRVVARSRYDPTSQSLYIGFRCARDF
jgi:formylglycine-generating enzyme required for sulfatase activity